MIDCPVCSRRHKTVELIERCAERHLLRASRDEKRAAEVARRAANAVAVPVDQFIRAQNRMGAAWVNSIAALNQEYPAPEGKTRWTILEFAEAYAATLNWPGVDQETKVWMLIEKHMLGDFVTIHPLQLASVQGALDAAGAMDPGLLANHFDSLREEDGPCGEGDAA